MARKPTRTDNPPSIVTEADTPGLPALVETTHQLALEREQRRAATRALAERIGYQLPVDSAEPELIARDIAANMHRSVEACLEIGKGLLVLKEACEHGEFLSFVEKLGLEYRLAARFMQAARKFSNVSTSTHLLKAINSQCKLLELLVLDDEQIEELELTGQTGELALDDVATMSVKELRTAVRKARQKEESTGRLLEAKNAKIDELDAALNHRVKNMPSDEVGQEIRRDAALYAFEAEAILRGKLFAAFTALSEHAEKHGLPHDEFMSGLVCQIEVALKALRGEFGIKTAPDGDETPEWLRPGAYEAAEAEFAQQMAAAGWTVDAQGRRMPPASPLPEETHEETAPILPIKHGKK
jgi:phosphotransferase system HPr-like phosphotransfer protein